MRRLARVWEDGLEIQLPAGGRGDRGLDVAVCDRGNRLGKELLGPEVDKGGHADEDGQRVKAVDVGL